MATNAAYEAIFNKIVQALEAGVIPWKQPWSTVRPQNAKTGRPYNGINFFVLSMSKFSDPRWMTYNQARELGGLVRKGEKSTPIVFWTIIKKDDAATGKEKSFPVLKYFNVFNVEQIDGLELEPLAENTPKDKIDAAELIVEGYLDMPAINKSNRAAYSPSLDVLLMPEMSAFKTSEDYYATLFHEMAHSTGHESRLNRKLDTSFGNENYSQEELIAEFTSAMLCSVAGIDNTLNDSAAYIAGWLKALKNDKNMLVHAASKAQKAADYILQPADETEETE